MEFVTKGNLIELISGDYFRVCNIARLIGMDESKKIISVEHLDPKHGLSVEYKTPDNDHLVITFIKYDKETNEPYLDGDCEDAFEILRLLKNSITDPINLQLAIEEFYNCLDFAKQAIIDMNENAEDQECCA